MCVLPHGSCWLDVCLELRSFSRARGDRTTATGRPSFTISTQPSAATSSSSPPKLFFACLAETRFMIWLF